MSTPIGSTCWAIAEGYIPPASSSDNPALASHETACLLNTNELEARVSVTVYFKDREPAGPYQIIVPGRRTLHLRFNDLSDPEPLPLGVDFASVIRADRPIVVQHTRLDSRQAALALMTTLAHAQH